MKKATRVFFAILIFLLTMLQSLKAQDDILFRRHLINSGINGLFYGGAIVYIVEADGGAAAGIPIITAGTSVIIPLLTNSSKTITPNSMILSAHGKLIGWAHGFALATLIGGENAWSDNGSKVTLGLGMVTSISLGILGNSLGKNSNWTEGQVALYRHYGWMVPLSAVMTIGAFVEEPRVLGATELIFGAGSYFLADKVYKNYQYSRGDVRAIQVLTVLNGGFGLGILSDKADRENSSRSDLIFPAIGVLSGSLIGQAWLKNVHLTTKQGLQTAYAATGGAILGLGFALLTGSDNITPYYVIPYITGLGAYAIAVESMRKKNKTQGFFQEQQKNRWNIAFMPQNVFLNSKISDKGYLVNGRITGMQPFFAASLRF
jgi:hypothetical protein